MTAAGGGISHPSSFERYETMESASPSKLIFLSAKRSNRTAYIRLDMMDRRKVDEYLGDGVRYMRCAISQDFHFVLEAYSRPRSPAQPSNLSR